MSVGVIDAVERVLPALIDQSSVGVPTVFDEAVAVSVAVLENPAHRPVGRGDEGRAVVRGKSTPAVEFTEQHDEQRRGVGGAVVSRAATQNQRRFSAEPHLVQYAAGLFLGEGVDLVALQARKGA
jgi:hypothetical protein